MREYSISGGGITLANAAVTLVFINPAAAPNVGIRILRAWVGQSANATSAQQRVQLVVQPTAFPTLTSATPQKLKIGDSISVITGGTAGAAGTAGINASAEGAGTKIIKVEDAFNVLSGWLYVPTPNEYIELPSGSAHGFGLHLPVAATTLTNWAFGITYAEI
jgi:hypothetical protein